MKKDAKKDWRLVNLPQIPIWNSWVNWEADQFFLEVFGNWETAGSRKGVPRGEPIPFSGEKIMAVILTTIYPRGIKTTDDVGKSVGASGDLIRKWRREEAFRTAVKKLEVEFAKYVLNNLENEDFLFELYRSRHEPIAWSNNILAIFSVELVNALDMIVIDEDQRKQQTSVLKRELDYIPFQLPVSLPYDPNNTTAPDGSPMNTLRMGMTFDLLESAGLAMKTRGGKRGRKPYEQRKYRTAEALRLVTSTTPTSFLIGTLDLIEEGLLHNEDTEAIIELVRGAKMIIEKEFQSQKEEEEAAFDKLVGENERDKK